MELPVIDFIRARIAEADPDFETRPGTVYHEMFIKPQMLMLQPLNNTLDQLAVSQSIRRILSQPDPEAYSESDVDDLVANLYVFRDAGDYAKCTVRVYYTTPSDKQFPATTAEFTYQGLSFFNTLDVSITSAEMALQTEGTLYYLDMTVQAQNPGTEYNATAGSITGFVNDAEAVRVSNITDAIGGLTKETNTQLLTRAQNSIGVRDLETVKGINATLFEKFPFIQRLMPIGMGDPEMQRDIVYNVHVGGKTDVYVKTPALTTATKDFVGLDYDYTRGIDRQLHIMMARSVGDAILPSFTGTPQILAGSVTVKEDIVETSAFLDTVAIPTGLGINLVGKEWIKIKIDSLSTVNVKISGATPSQTQRFEIINSINSTVGYTVATVAPGNKIRVTSRIIGLGSSVTVFSSAPLNNGATALFGISTFPSVYEGIAAERYTETTDYELDYVNGNIYQLPYLGRNLPTILSGQEMVNKANGTIQQIGTEFHFYGSDVDEFLKPVYPSVKVRVGDELTISSIGGATTGTVLGDLPQVFIVSEVIDTNKLKLQNFAPSGIALDVEYKIVSNQTVVVDYKFNPISIDIGGQVLLADGLVRGVRPGRSAYTITNTPFIDILSIQEIDPESGEAIGDPLLQPRGFGYGGFGEGSYGVGAGGDYEFRILAPRERFSVFDDAVILFSENALSKSYRVTYRHVPEIVAIHNLSRNDAERVTGADVLIRHYVPAFVDVTIGIRRDATNLTTPTNDALAGIVSDFINGKSGSAGIQASDISKILEDLGVDSVRTPFAMVATVLNTDGTTTILESEDILQFPSVTLPRDTTNYVTDRIVHFLPGTVSVVEV